MVRTFITKQVKIAGFWSLLCIVLFQNTLEQDLCPDGQSLPGEIQPYTKHPSFRSFGSSSDCVVPVARTVAFSWGNRAVCLNSGFAAAFCCFRGLYPLRSAAEKFLLLLRTNVSDCFFLRGRLQSIFLVILLFSKL